MAENTYFQFPLCALAFGLAERERLDAIISYGVVENGRKLLDKLTGEQQRQFFFDKKKAQKLPEEFDGSKSTHRAAVYGAERIGITLGSLLGCIQRYQALRDYVVAFENTHGGDALVRIKKNWVFDARDSGGLSYREFSLLCGLYSAIGNKKLAVVPRDRIQCRALGYRAAAIMQAELPGRADKAQPLTERRLRDAIERLHQNKFFASCTVSRRIKYYSIRLDNEALRKTVLEKRTYKATHRAIQAAQDEALTAEINRKRREADRAAPKTPLKLRVFGNSH